MIFVFVTATASAAAICKSMKGDNVEFMQMGEAIARCLGSVAFCATLQQSAIPIIKISYEVMLSYSSYKTDRYMVRTDRYGINDMRYF